MCLLLAEVQSNNTMACRVRNIRTSHDQRRRSSAAFMHDTSQLTVPFDALKTRRGSANSLLDIQERRPTLTSLGLTDNARRRLSLAPPSPGAGPVRRKSAPDRPFALDRRESDDNMELKKRNVFATIVVVCLGLLLVLLFASYIKGLRVSA